MTPAVIFGSLNIVKSIAAYFGLIESVDGNVKKLLHQSFKSATQNLNYAKSATSHNLQEDYLRRAREKFIDAISVEGNENLISSYVGLAMCQHLLGDTYNADITFQKINDVELSRSEKAKAIAEQTVGNGLLLPLFSVFCDGDAYNNRVEKFLNYKSKALATK